MGLCEQQLPYYIYVIKVPAFKIKALKQKNYLHNQTCLVNLNVSPIMTTNSLKDNLLVKCYTYFT